MTFDSFESYLRAFRTPPLIQMATAFECSYCSRDKALHPVALDSDDLSLVPTTFCEKFVPFTVLRLVDDE